MCVHVCVAGGSQINCERMVKSNLLQSSQRDPPLQFLFFPLSPCLLLSLVCSTLILKSHALPAYNDSMPFRLKVSLALLLAIITAILVVPFVVPVPSLENTVTERDLADPDSLFMDVNDVTLHYKEVPATAGSDLTFILLHGFGSSLATWHNVMDELGQYGRVIAFDRPAFGLTERPLRGTWEGTNPYSPQGQVELTLELLDELGVDKAVLVGNSAGGGVAAQVALEHPERVAGLILVDAAIYEGGGAPPWVRPILSTPQMNRVGPLIMRQFGGEPGENFLRSAWSKPENIPESTWESYREPLRVKDWDKALWELTKASRRPNFISKLSSLNVPTLVLSGADDKIVSLQLSERLAKEIPNAKFVQFASCGHMPQEECPQPFVEAVTTWLGESITP
jgi:pimeloyl-ACP methyl ester carboxylesterase